MRSPPFDVAALAALLVAAALTDVAWRRISNWNTVAIAVAGVIAQWAAGGIGAAAGGMLAGIVIGALLAPFWIKRIIGGGDLKLAVAAGVWVGLARSPRYLLASALAGGLIAIVCYALSRRGLRAFIRANGYRLHASCWPRALQKPGRPVVVPYGVAFAAGALFTLSS